MSHLCTICHKEFPSPESLVQHHKSAHPGMPMGKSIPGYYWVIGAGIIVAILVGFMLFGGGSYDEFAQCISDSGAKFYGAFWCPHCSDQKALFGASAKYLPYVECSTSDRQSQLPVCQSVGIESYPTWIFADGTRSGQMTLEELSQKTGCPISS